MTMTPAQQVIAENMSESELQDKIVRMAEVSGWIVHAERPARTTTGWRTPIQGDAGFPDLILVNEHQVLFVECKSEKGKLTIEQEEWRRILRSAHVRNFVCVWRPSDWCSGEVERVLRGE